MTEQSPEDRTDYEQSFEDIINSKDGLPYFGKLRSFDTKRNELYDQLSQLPTQLEEIAARQTGLTIDVGGVAECLSQLIRAKISDGSSSEEIIDLTTEIFQQDAQERRDLLNAVAKEQVIGFFADGAIESLISTCIENAETTEDVIDNIAQLYGYDLKNDIEKFVKAVFDKSGYNSSACTHIAEQPTRHEKKSPKEHAIDIAKVALGVTLALAANRLLGNPNLK